MNNKKGQMKIQQMAFMIMAVFIFFALVGLFFINWQVNKIRGGADDLNKEKAISSLEVIANMPEFNCGTGRTLCVDEDKLEIMTGTFAEDYQYFWPIASIKVYKIYPKFTEVKECPGVNCNYWEIYEDEQQEDMQEYSTYISICKKIREQGYVYERCEIGKILIGMNIQGN